MPYIIRNQAGVMVGHCTNKHGDGNKLPNGDDEVHDLYETDPDDPAYDEKKIAEAAAFAAAQDAKFAARRSPAAQLVEQIKADPDALAALKAELAK